MRPKERFNVWKWDGCCLVDDDKIRVPNFIRIVREDKLYKLCMMFEDIDSHDCLIVLLVSAEDSIEVLPLLIF
jgi:hypothetical protein